MTYVALYMIASALSGLIASRVGFNYDPWMGIAIFVVPHLCYIAGFMRERQY